MPLGTTTLLIIKYLFSQDTYQEMVQYLVSSQTDPNNKARLVEAFHELTKDIPLTGERVYRMKFRESFDKFVVNVRGFLLVK